MIKTFFHSWEHRLASATKNRVVRPFEWGLDWLTLEAGGAGKLTNHVNVPTLIRFHVRDPGLGDSAKGLFTGQLRGGVRPLLDWTTEFVESRAYETA